MALKKSDRMLYKIQSKWQSEIVLQWLETENKNSGEVLHILYVYYV